jgi:hypothetical protein
MIKKTEEINILILSWTDYIPLIKKIGRKDRNSLLSQALAPYPIPPASQRKERPRERKEQ